MPGSPAAPAEFMAKARAPVAQALTAGKAPAGKALQLGALNADSMSHVHQAGNRRGFSRCGDPDHLPAASGTVIPRAENGCGNEVLQAA